MAILPTLGMPNAVLRIELEPIEPPGRSGAERVEFLASPNRGFDVRPLSRIASGGELSRFMLALKSVLATEDRVPLLIFDEIDAGVGGEAAVGVADQLRHVASHHQVLVITHLPQVAARGDRHVRIEKGESDGMTTTSLVRLEGEARVVEIARMLGGDPDSRLSRDHARELLGEAVSRE